MMNYWVMHKIKMSVGQMYHYLMFWMICELKKVTGFVLFFSKAAIKLALMSVSSKRSEDPLSGVKPIWPGCCHTELSLAF